MGTHVAEERDARMSERAGTATRVAASARRPFCIDEQLRIFFDRTIYPELLRRTVPFNGSRLYTYPVEDVAMFKRTYARFRSGLKPWKSVAGTGRSFHPEFASGEGYHLVRIWMKDPDGQTVLGFFYRLNREPDANEGKHCALYIQFVQRYGEEPYEDLRGNMMRLMDILDPAPQAEEPSVGAA